MKQRTNKVLQDLFYEILLFLITVFIIALTWKNNILTLVLLLVLWAIPIFFWPKKGDLAYFLIAAILASIAEIIAIKFGALQYSNSDFLGIPIWLPVAWGCGAVLLNRLKNIFSQE
jgi:hypothetical protein